MELDEKQATSGFRKKVYTRMYNDSISHLQADCEKPRKKIIPTSKINGVREEFKKTFLPLLIDVFELRQMVQNYKSRNTTSSLLFNQKERSKSPQEIIERLEQLHADIEESKRWCEGVIGQISKGIEEAKDALQFIENSSEIERDKSAEQRGGRKKFHVDVGPMLDNRRKNRLWNMIFKKKRKRTKTDPS